MPQRLGSALKVEMFDEAAEPVAAPTLLVRLEPRYRVFFSNLGDLFWTRRRPPLRLISWPAAPWPDIFVPSRLPWRGLSESVALHLAVIAVVVWLTPLLVHREIVVHQPVFNSANVIYYSPSEYLPPLDTGSVQAAQPQKGEPAYAPQPIISVPPEADNHTQTIVTPPDIKLNHDVPLPNIVAWSPTPVAVPMAATARPITDLKIPALTPQVVAPAPEVNRVTGRQAPALQPTVAAPSPEVNLGLQRRSIGGLEASVVAPAPQMDAASSRRLGDINIGHSSVVAPAPQLPVGEQHVAAGGGSTLGSGGPSVVAPPPSMQGMGSSSGRGGGQVIALSVRPAPPSAAAEIPAGNRRGTFAATPEGKPGAAGTPDLPGGKGQTGTGSNSNGQSEGIGSAKNATGVPPGLQVGAAPKNAEASAIAGGNSSSDSPTLTASVTLPRIGSTPRSASPEVAPENATELERKVFSGRRFYSMTINIPNLNSASGNWIIRFAELHDNKDRGDLSSPVATQTTDPAYPLELMRRNIQGIVTLYAVIRSDGSVGEIRVLDGINDRLDEYARVALSRWHFLPALKNGNAVDLEAVVKIPFKPARFKSSF